MKGIEDKMTGNLLATLPHDMAYYAWYYTWFTTGRLTSVYWGGDIFGDCVRVQFFSMGQMGHILLEGLSKRTNFWRSLLVH